jgi:hypothetical protein
LLALWFAYRDRANKVFPSWEHLPRFAICGLAIFTNQFCAITGSSFPCQQSKSFSSLVSYRYFSPIVGFLDEFYALCLFVCFVHLCRNQACWWSDHGSLAGFFYFEKTPTNTLHLIIHFLTV